MLSVLMLKTTLLRKRKHQEPVFVVYFLTLFFTTISDIYCFITRKS